jgi:hypothetical protein
MRTSSPLDDYTYRPDLSSNEETRPNVYFTFHDVHCCTDIITRYSYHPWHAIHYPILNLPFSYVIH